MYDIKQCFTFGCIVFLLGIGLSGALHIQGYKDHAFNCEMALNATLFAVITMLVHALKYFEEDSQTMYAAMERQYNDRLYWMRQYHETLADFHALKEEVNKLRNELSRLQGELTEIQNEPEFPTSVLTDIICGVPTAPSMFSVHANAVGQIEQALV